MKSYDSAPDKNPSTLKIMISIKKWSLRRLIRGSLNDLNALCNEVCSIIFVLIKQYKITKQILIYYIYNQIVITADVENC